MSDTFFTAANATLPAQSPPGGKAKKLKFCPYDGNLLQPKTKFCSRCRRTVNLQPIAPRKPRNFYEKMPEGVADNYTDDLFLKGLVHKNSFPKLHYLPMIRETAEVINVLNALSCFITTFFYLLGVKNSDVAVCVCTFGALILCYIGYWVLNKKKLAWSDLIDNLGQIIFLSFILAFLSPVLQSLTVTYDSDSVALFVGVFSIGHLWAYDYERVRHEAIHTVVKSPTSLNAIFVAAILLASRLTRFISVFLLLFQSLLLFGFGPNFRSMLRSHSRVYYELFTIGFTLSMFAIIFALNHLIGVIYLLSALGVALGGPLLFIYAYKFKNDIRGPWDIPKIKQLHHLS